MPKCFIFMLSFLLLATSQALSQDHARGFSQPGTLGNPGEPKQIEISESEIKETQLSNIRITKVADLSNLAAALIDAGREQGLNLGDTLTVVRRLDGKPGVVGEVTIIEVFKQTSVVQLLQPRKVKPVESRSLQVGDRFLKPEIKLRRSD